MSKKVWVLEKFTTAEEMIENLNSCEHMLDENNVNLSDDTIEACKQAIILRRKDIKENPNGKWFGWEGKTNYYQFCDVAKAALQRADKSCKFRVVEGEIDDDAKYWTDYSVVKVNEGVLRYLYSQVRYTYEAN